MVLTLYTMPLLNVTGHTGSLTNMLSRRKPETNLILTASGHPIVRMNANHMHPRADGTWDIKGWLTGLGEKRADLIPWTDGQFAPGFCGRPVFIKGVYNPEEMQGHLEFFLRDPRFLTS